MIARYRVKLDSSDCSSRRLGEAIVKCGGSCNVNYGVGKIPDIIIKLATDKVNLFREICKPIDMFYMGS